MLVSVILDMTCGYQHELYEKETHLNLPFDSVSYLMEVLVLGGPCSDPSLQFFVRTVGDIVPPSIHDKQPPIDLHPNLVPRI